ncbi:hypothetical protein [Fluviicola chungangensis]|uniref:Uncharacterized protein n=1 Tax=Fluviicola chungangensis TaxID=2597671 RepID=A0A556N7H4_9FLAO|nr:hypothetical protein [Fluviicola chungangensis]TSJ48080.1 hypothetical protein FO442_02805 [Fluviicola chungangensis]
MYQVLTAIFAGSALLTTAQTPLIFHKSHAGTAINYVVNPMSNFGAIKTDFDRPAPELKSYPAKHFRSMNDSAIILEVTDFNQKIIETDTLSNKQRYSETVFRARYLDSIQKEEQMQHYQEELKQAEESQMQLELKQKQLDTPKKKKEKKSYLLFLFGITGGGMLILKVFGQSKPSIS